MGARSQAIVPAPDDWYDHVQVEPVPEPVINDYDEELAKAAVCGEGQARDFRVALVTKGGSCEDVNYYCC